MSPSTRLETISLSPLWRAACTSSEEIISGICIIWPIRRAMVLLLVAMQR